MYSIQNYLMFMVAFMPPFRMTHDVKYFMVNSTFMVRELMKAHKLETSLGNYHLKTFKTFDLGYHAIGAHMKQINDP